MNLSAERQYVADLLDGLDGEAAAYTYLPARTSLPAWLVTPSDPFLTSGNTPTTGTLHLTLTFITTTGENDVMQASLDTAVSAAVSALIADSADFKIDGGSSPFQIKMNGQNYLAQSVTVSFIIDL